MAVDVQRLELGDVVLVDRGDGSGEVAAKVVRPVDRAGGVVRASLRAEGGEEFVQDWKLGEQVTVVRGP